MTPKTNPRTTKSEYARALDRLTRYLALRDHSRYELQQKLTRHFSREIVDPLLLEAEERGWLIPENQIAERATLVWQRQLKSRRYIEGQLRKRHLPLPPRADQVECQNARVLIERKFGAPHTLNYADKARAYRYLLNRGFAPHLIGKVFHETEL